MEIKELHMKNVKVVLIDIDDTLLYRPDGIEQIIPQENIEIIKKVKEKGIHIVSVAIDAPQDKISALAGKVGKIDGISVKTAYSNVVT